MKKLAYFTLLAALLLLCSSCAKQPSLPVIALPNENGAVYTDGKTELIKTYKKNRYAAVQYYVTAHGAVGDGIQDDTKAIQEALDRAAQDGGGTVYIPAGRYRITSQLIIPDDVTLLGYFCPPTLKGSAAEDGTILICEENSFTLSNSLIILNDNSSISDLTVWYEGQSYDNVKEYPYTIVQNSGESASVLNIALLNSWNGIMFSSGAAKKLNVENIYITAFGTGFNIVRCTDRVILQNINLSPIYWINSSLTEKKEGFSATQLTDIMYNGLCAISIGAVSDASIYGVNIDTAADGIIFDIPVAMNGSAIASNLTISNVTRAVTVESAGKYGLAFAACTFRTTDLLGSYAVRTGTGFTSSAVFNTCSFPGQPYKTVISEGNGKLSFMNCKYTGWRTCALDIQGGALSSVSNGYSSENQIGSFTNLAVGVFCNDSYTEGNYADGNTFFTQSENEYSYTGIKTSWLITSDSIPDIRDVIYRAEDYGVSPDNADNTDVVQALIDKAADEGGGIVFLKEGTYKISGTLRVRSGVRLCGASSDTKTGGKTVLIAPLSLTDRKIIYMESKSSLFDISIAYNGLPDFSTLAEDEKPTSYAVVTAPNASDIHIENISLRAAPNGIYLDSTDDCTVKNVTGTAFSYGIYAYNCNRLRLKGITFDTRYADTYSTAYQQEHFVGFCVYGGSDISVLNCYVDNADYGILVNSGEALFGTEPLVTVNALLAKNCYAGFCIEKSTLSVFINTIAYCAVFDKNAYHGSTLSTSSGRINVYNMICGGKATASLIVRGNSEMYVETCIFNGDLANTVRMLGGYIEAIGNIIAVNPLEYHLYADNGSAVFMGNLVTTALTYAGLNEKYLRKNIGTNVMFLDYYNIKEYDAPRVDDGL